MRLAKAIVGLKKSPAGLGKLIAALPAAAWLADPQGLTQYRNPAWRRLMGIDPNDFDDWLDLTPGDQRGECEAAWSALRASRMYGILATRLRHNDGVYRDAVIDVAPFLDETGVLAGWLCSGVEEGPP